VFILYSIAIGLVLGLALGGDPRRLATIRFRWMPVVFVGLAVQLVLFSEPVAERVGSLGPPLYVLSTAAVLAAVVRNWRIPGLPVVICGAASNLAAIVANGGYMPAGLAAVASFGKPMPETYSNSALMPSPALGPLTDIFALPAWLPFANVFSVGDMLIGIGVAWAIVATMRRSVPASADPAPLDQGGANEQRSLVGSTESTVGPYGAPNVSTSVKGEGRQFLRRATVQGKPVARRGTQS